LVLICLLGVPAFALTSIAVNDAPTPRVFHGWAAVLQENAPTAARVQLAITPVIPGGYGAAPAMRYLVAACGREEFRGVLLLGGQAQLDDVRTIGPAATAGQPGAPPTPRLTTISDLRLEDTPTGEKVELGDVQAIRLTLPATRCVVPFTTDDRQDPSFFGTAVEFAGRLRGPVQRWSWTPLGIGRPPRAAQAWPLIGTLPHVNPGLLGEFRFGSKLPGRWSRASQSYFRVDVGALDAKGTLDFARPEPASATSLSWGGTRPFAAAARVTNNDNLATWQSFLLAAAIWFGIGGSVIAAFAFEFVRPSSRSAATTTTARPASDSTSDCPAPSPGLTLLAVLVLAIVTRRRR
jgi:MYXO-CTERM domain-containing protein